MADAKPRAPLNDLNRLIRENRVADYPSPNLALGMAPVEFGSGTSRWRWQVQPAVALNPFGTVQGGYIAVFIDELLSTAIASVLENDEWAMTAEFKINFLRPLAPGPIDGNARVIRRSRTLAFLDAEAAGADGNVAVTASSTWAVVRR